METSAAASRPIRMARERGMALAILVAKVANHSGPEVEQRPAPLALAQIDGLPTVAPGLAHDEVQPAFEGQHVLGPASGGPDLGPAKVEGQAKSFPGCGGPSQSGGTRIALGHLPLF